MLISADPGITGALAVYDWRTGYVATYAIPVAPTGPDGRNRVEPVDLASLVACLAMLEPVAAIFENTNGRGGQDAAAAYQFGRAAGIVEGQLAAAGVPLEFVSPSAWKPRLGVPADKRQARARASVLLPQAATQWKKQKQHGHAEAALLAYYGAHVLGLDGCAGVAAQRPRIRITAGALQAIDG